MADKNSALSENFIIRTLERATELPFEVISKGGGADLLKTGAITEEERQGFAEQDQANQQILKDYQDRIQAINQLIPQRRQPELKKLYDEIRANTDFDPLTLRDRFRQFQGFYFNDTAAIHDKVARGEVRVKDLRGDDLTNYLFGLFDIADITTLGLAGIATRPLRLAINAFRAGKAGLAKQFLTEAGDETAQTVSSNVVGGMDMGKAVDEYGVRLQKDDGTGGGSSTSSTFVPNKTQQKLIDANTFGSAETIAKIEKAIAENPDKAPTGVTEFAKNYGIGKPNYLSAYIAKLITEGKLPEDYFVKQDMTEFQKKGTEGAATKKLSQYDPVKQEIEAFYLANKDKFKDQGVEFFTDELLKNTSITSISPKYIADNLSGYEDIKTPGMKSDVYNKGKAKSNLKKVEEKLNKYGIYGAERARSRNNFYILSHSYRHKPDELDDILTNAGAMTKDEFKKANPNLTTKEVNEAYSDYAYNVGQKMVDDELLAYIRLEEPDNLVKFEAKLNTRDEFNKWVSNEIDEYFFNPNPTEAQAVFIEKYKDALSKATGKNYDNPKAFKKALMLIYKTDLSHSFPIRAYSRELPGAGGFADMIKVNFSSLNTGQQAAADGFIKRAVRQLKKMEKDPKGNFANTPENREILNAVIEEFASINKEFEERLITSYHKIDNPELAQILKTYFPDRVDEDAIVEIIEGFEKGEKVKTKELQPGIVFGTPINIEPTLDDLKTYWLDHIRDGELGIKDPKFVGKRGPKHRGPLAGIMSTVAPGKPDYTFFDKGGDAETEQENQSFLSKAATTIGNILIPQAEALPLPKNFLVGDTPKIVKKSDDIKQLTGPEAPLMEKRYNIFDENGNKVYQSKSIDDATQKSLILGEREGKTFTVKEVEVPIKQKKKNITTKPGTSLVPTVTPETIIGSGNNKLYYSDLNDLINAPTLNIKGTNVTSERVSMSAKDWHDWFRSKNIKEGELYDSYVRSYLNKKGGFNRETGKFTNDEKISYAEIKELVDTSPTNYIQSVSYSDVTGTLKYGNSGRHDGYLPGTRVERVLWLDSKDIRGDIGSLPDEVRRYEGHRSMREVQTSPEFSTQGNTLNGEPYVVGWSLNSHRNATLNNRNIKVNVADEIQSDFLQKASSLKANIKREIRNYIQDRPNILPGQSEELDNLYKRLENVFRPMPATYAQLKKSIDALIDSDAVFQKISDMELDDLTKESFKELGEAAKIRDKALAEINATIDNIDVRELFPNIPFKDQKDWVDAIIKNDLYHAAKARFSFDESGKLVVNQDAPAYYAVAPAKAIKAYRGGRGVELPPDNIDRNGTMVAYDMQYGGPNLNDHTGAHFTSNVEETLNKIANMKSSKVEVGKVDFGHAGEAVDTFMIELTPDMLMPYKAYKKDGGLVKKSILYTPIISVNELLSPIGASRW